MTIRGLYSKEVDKKDDIQVDNLKELRIYTPDGMTSFDTFGLSKVEGYGKFQKDRVSKIIKNVLAKSGILSFIDRDGKLKKIDLTMQTTKAQLIYKK